MSRTRAFVEFSNDKAIRIIRNDRAAAAEMVQHPDADIREWPRGDAVSQIRQQVWERTKGECEWCGKRMTSKQMHLHERLFRSHGGEISLVNSVGICYWCHEGGRDAAHQGLKFGMQRP